MKSHGQNKEDIAICNYFDSVEQYTGKVLDIGAYDAITFSNSRTLIESGWEGVLIEADFGNAERARVNSIGHNAVVLCAAVMPHETGIAEFYSSGGDMVGSTEKSHVNKWSKDVKFNVCHVATISTMSILNHYRDTFDFINIDVEGISAELAKVMIPMFKNCKCICIEHDGQADYLAELCRQYGYQHELMRNSENLIMGK